ncbi:MAG: molybdopterin-dependent oxidoreductase [Xanthomonadales bacterium]|nr:molybdopterin-dependent oxidoreductase [Xanthomonadales bacterium]
MSTLQNESNAISRREFLKASGLSVGGLIIGVSFAPGLMGSVDSTGFEPNAFVYIAPNGDTTIYCGRCEMGQGISTALPAAVADELEADWSRVRVLQGDADKKYGPQATGGSQSINKMLEPMRKAGAAGGEMLIAAAAQTWNIPVENCYAKSHAVYNRVNDLELTYGELVALASTLPVPGEPVLKTRDQFSYIGKSLQRHDQRDMAVGKRIFGADKKVPGVKYAAIKHVPVLGGSVKSVDKSAVQGMPGVVDVVVIPRFENAFGSVGGVAVVADNTWIAQKALAKLNIEFEAGENASYNTDEYMKLLVRNVEQPATSEFEKGSVDKAFAEATLRHKATYVGGHISHSPMEPMASLVWVQEDRCEIWASTQDPETIQKTVGAYLGREPEDIIVHVMMAGGAFGRKFKCDYVQEAAALSKAVGAPVQLTWSREEDTRTGFYHSCSAQHIEASVDAQGKVTGWLHRAAFPAIDSTFDPTVVQPSADDLDTVSKHPYGIENMRVESGMAPAHTRIGWFRSVYNVFYGFSINVFTDELAHEAGVDSLQFFRSIYDNNKNTEQAEKVKRSRAVLDKAADMAGWGQQLPAGHGMGIAVHHSFASYAAMVVHVEVKGENITVHRVDCAVDCGLVLNPDIATAQMEGAVIMGMSLALNPEISFKNGAVVNSNFYDYPVLLISEAPPEINVEFIGQDYRSTGIGEPGVPTLPPALANAIYAATGKRCRSIPVKLT